MVRGPRTGVDVWRPRWRSRSGWKLGVIVGNGPGFVGNRLMFPYMYEAQFLVEEGATPEQVDHALTDFGMAMGIFAVDDMAGLDVAWRVRQELDQFDDPGAENLGGGRTCLARARAGHVCPRSRQPGRWSWSRARV